MSTGPVPCSAVQCCAAAVSAAPSHQANRPQVHWRQGSSQAARHQSSKKVRPGDRRSVVRLNALLASLMFARHAVFSGEIWILALSSLHLYTTVDFGQSNATNYWAFSLSLSLYALRSIMLAFLMCVRHAMFLGKVQVWHSVQTLAASRYKLWISGSTNAENCWYSLSLYVSPLRSIGVPDISLHICVCDQCVWLVCDQCVISVWSVCD